MGQGAARPARRIVSVPALEMRPSGLRTLTRTSVGMAMSAAERLAVACVPPATLVDRGTPFHSKVAPDAKPEPFTVNVNAGPPAVTVAGVSAVTRGPGAAASRRSRAGATWIIGFVTVPPGRVSVTGTPVARRASSTSLTEAPGTACLSTAQAPATCGAANEVPELLPTTLGNDVA